MKTIKTKSGDILLVKVPKQQEFCLVNDKLFHTDKGEWFNYNNIDYSSWKILTTASKITEEQAMELVELTRIEIGFMNYGNRKESIFCRTALESFHSLMEANDCDTQTGEYLILIEKK